MKKILITGASGFLGSRAVSYYKDRYEVYAPTHGEMDITDKKSVEAVFLQTMPDIVIHCAAVSDVGLCEREKECLRINPDCVLLRLSWMYDRELKNAGEHGDFLRTLILKRKLREPFDYPVYDIRGISYVREVIENLEKTFALKGGVYNFGSPNDDNTYEMMCGIFTELGWDAGQIGKNTEAFREAPRNLSMCQKKLNASGISFKTTRDQILENLRSIG